MRREEMRRVLPQHYPEPGFAKVTHHSGKHDYRDKGSQFRAHHPCAHHEQLQRHRNRHQRRHKNGQQPIPPEPLAKSGRLAIWRHLFHKAAPAVMRCLEQDQASHG